MEEGKEREKFWGRKVFDANSIDAKCELLSRVFCWLEDEGLSQ